MDVGMKVEFARPGVEHHRDAEGGLKSGVSEGEQRFAGRVQERIEDL
jgi:hypothetical protein